MFSVIILTKNEEQDLPGCIASLTWCDDIHVFDSYSTDKTVEIATNLGASVIQHRFSGYASQRNAALRLSKCKHQWVFFLDADERIPSSLVDEINLKITATDNNLSAFSIRRKDYLNSTWLKHAQITPYYVRCFKPECVRYVREVNEVIEVEGKLETLKEHFDHFPFSKGYSHWLNKHNLYSSMEAQRWTEEQGGKISFSLKKALFGKSLTEKRYNQKGLFYKVPGRPIIKWLYIMFVRRAVLDGRAGVTYASLQAIYEYFIVLKTRELIKHQKANNN